jgi:hypothetical protein
VDARPVHRRVPTAQPGRHPVKTKPAPRAGTGQLDKPMFNRQQGRPSSGALFGLVDRRPCAQCLHRHPQLKYLRTGTSSARSGATTMGGAGRRRAACAPRVSAPSWARSGSRRAGQAPGPRESLAPRCAVLRDPGPVGCTGRGLQGRRYPGHGQAKTASSGRKPSGDPPKARQSRERPNHVWGTPSWGPLTNEPRLGSGGCPWTALPQLEPRQLPAASHGSPSPMAECVRG